MASANLSFTKDGSIYRPQHFLDDDDDELLSENSQKDAGMYSKETPTAIWTTFAVKGGALFTDFVSHCVVG